MSTVSATMTETPLPDLLVVDLSRALAGPHATMMMGDLGARVIKVEARGKGDDTRGWGPRSHSVQAIRRRPRREDVPATTRSPRARPA